MGWNNLARLTIEEQLNIVLQRANREGEGTLDIFGDKKEFDSLADYVEKNMPKGCVLDRNGQTDLGVAFYHIIVKKVGATA